MPVFRLNGDDTLFPPVGLAEPGGLLAVGGDLSVERLLAAYSQGIFPWDEIGSVRMWFSPDPRLVLFPGELHVSKSMQRLLRHPPFDVTVDNAFREVIESCAAVPGREETWIDPEIVGAYTALHEAGYAHSVEVRQDGELVGGLYGVSLGSVFFGESMFTRVPNASKFALAHLVGMLRDWDFQLIDCQQATDHLVRMGAREIPREAFLDHMKDGLQMPTRRGNWS